MIRTSPNENCNDAGLRDKRRLQFAFDGSDIGIYSSLYNSYSVE